MSDRYEDEEEEYNYLCNQYTLPPAFILMFYFILRATVISNQLEDVTYFTLRDAPGCFCDTGSVVLFKDDNYVFSGNTFCSDKCVGDPECIFAVQRYESLTADVSNCETYSTCVKTCTDDPYTQTTGDVRTLAWEQVPLGTVSMIP